MAEKWKVFEQDLTKMIADRLVTDRNAYTGNGKDFVSVCIETMRKQSVEAWEQKSIC